MPATEEVADARGGKRFGIVSEHAVEDAPLSVVQDECHWVVDVIHLGSGGREDPNRRVAGQAGIEFVVDLEVLESRRDRVFGVHDADGERAARVVSAELRIPDPPGQVPELGPIQPGAAREVDEHESFASLDEVPKVGSGCLAWSGHLPIHEVQQHGVVGVHGRRIEQMRILDYRDGEARVLMQHCDQGRRCFAPRMAGVIDAGDQEDAFL